MHSYVSKRCNQRRRSTLRQDAGHGCSAIDGRHYGAGALRETVSVTSRTNLGVSMYLVAIGWLYVALMMALAEAMHPSGGVLGAIFTFLLYGIAPVALVLYLMGTPMRGRARKAREAAELRAAAAAVSASDPVFVEPDQGGHAPGQAITSVRKEP
jgi:hypothetical protein